MKQFLYVIGFISYGMIAQNNVCFEIQNYSNPNEPALSYFTKYVNVLDCFDIFAESTINFASDFELRKFCPNFFLILIF